MATPALTLQEPELSSFTAIEGVDICYAFFPLLLPRLDELRRTLSPVELERASRFRLAETRDRFIAGRGFVRTLLARHLQAAPDVLELGEGPGGKPVLVGDQPPGTVRFNVSHSRDLLCCAVARGREIGVDIEFLRPIHEERDIVERFFSVREREIWQSASESDRHRAFFALWTRREALLKATGQGILGMLPSEGEANAWTVQRLSTPPGYVGALAVERLGAWDGG